MQMEEGSSNSQVTSRYGDSCYLRYWAHCLESQGIGQMPSASSPRPFKHSQGLSPALLFTWCILFPEVVSGSPMTSNKLLNVLSLKLMFLAWTSPLSTLVPFLSCSRVLFVKGKEDHITCFLKTSSEFFCY